MSDQTIVVIKLDTAGEANERVAEVAPSHDETVVIDGRAGARFLLVEKETGASPSNIRITQSGSDVLLFLYDDEDEDEESADPDVVVQNCTVDPSADHSDGRELEDLPQAGLCQVGGYVDGGVAGAVWHPYTAVDAGQFTSQLSGVFVLPDRDAAGVALLSGWSAAGGAGLAAIGAGLAVLAATASSGGSDTPNNSSPDAPVVNAINGSDPITGTAEPGAVVVLLDDQGDPILDKANQPIEALVASDGTFELPNPGFGDGTTLLIVAKEDTGGASEPTLAVVDDVAPDSPTIDPVNTSDPITGTAEPGSTVTLYDADGKPARDDADEIITAPVAEDGTYSLPNPGDLEDLDLVGVSATDAAGNEGSRQIETVDDKGPTSPDISPNGTRIELPLDAASGTVTFVPSGASDPITVFLEQDASAGGFAVAPTSPAALPEGSIIDGNRIILPREAAQDGSEVTAKAVDTAGNESDPATGRIDISAPDAPELDTPKPGDFFGDTLLTGTAEPGSTVTLTFPDGESYDTPANESGAFTFLVPDEVALPAGQLVTAVATDQAGNVSPSTSEPIGGTTAPASPLVEQEEGSVVIDLSEALADGADTATIAYTDAEGAEQLVTLLHDGSGWTGGVAPLSVDGNTVRIPNADLTDASTVEVTAFIAQGEDGTADDVGSEPARFVVDTAPPPSPAVTQADGQTTVVLPDGVETATVTYTPAGTTSPTTVEVLKDPDTGDWIASPDLPAGSSIDPDTGTVSIPNEALADGTPVTAKARDDVGNESLPGTATVDTNPPDAPEVTQADGSATVSMPDDAASAVVVFTPLGATEPVSVDLIKHPDAGWIVDPETSAKFPAGSSVDPETGELNIPNQSLADGEPVSAVAKDQAGNESPEGKVDADTTAPDTPTIDEIAGDAVSITGTASPGETVQITYPDGLTKEVVADATNGTYSFPALEGTTRLANAGDPVTVVAKDPAGNVSDPALSTVQGEDAVAPGKPTLGPVNETDPITGTAEAGSTVALLDADGDPVLDGDNNPITADVDADGTFEMTNPGLTDGDTVKVTATDAADNASEPVEAVVDGQAPDAPTVEQADGDTTVTPPAEAETVEISFTPAGASAPTVVSLVKDPDTGSWVEDPEGTTALPEGSTVDPASGTVTFPNVALQNDTPVSATATDAAGNESEPGETVVDSVAPVAPSVAQVDGDTTVTMPTDAEKAKVTFTPDGASEPTTVVLVKDPGTGDWVEDPDGTTDLPVGSSVDPTTGMVTIPNETLKNATPVTATVLDAAGNESAPGEATVDTVAPTLAITSSPVTEDTTPTITGTGEPGLTVTLDDGSGTPVTTVVDENGDWSYTPTLPVVDGTVFDVSQTDEVGNTTVLSDAVTVSSSAVPPVATLYPEDETGPNGSNVTRSSTPSIVNGDGSATPGDLITVYASDGITVLGTDTVDADGNWSIKPDGDPDDGENDTDPVADGTYKVKVTATNAAGVESDPTEITITVDTTPPSATITLNDDQLSAGETAVVTIDFSEEVDGFEIGDLSITGGGAAELSELVQDATDPTLYTAKLTPPSDASGSATIALATDSYEDLAGNKGGAASAGYDYQTAALAETKVNPVNAVDPITGTAEPGTTVTLTDENGDPVLDGAGVPITALVDGDGNYTLPNPGFGDGTKIRVIATDEVGNAASGSAIVDATLPEIIVTFVSGDDVTSGTSTGVYSAAERWGGDGSIPIDKATVSVAPSIAGTSDAGEGSTVSVLVNGNTYTGGVDAERNWSIVLTDTDAQALNHGSTYDIYASVADAAGNVGVDDKTSLKVDIAPPDIPTVTELVTSDTTPLLTGTAAKLALEAPIPLENGDTLSVVVNDITYELTIGDTPTALSYDKAAKTWALQIPDGDALSDGSYEVEVKVTAGGVDKFDISLTELHVGTAEPVVTLDVIASDDILNAAESALPVLISGSVSDDVAPGSTVTLGGFGAGYTGPVTTSVRPDGTFTLKVAAADVQAAFTEAGQNITATVENRSGVTNTQVKIGEDGGGADILDDARPVAADYTPPAVGDMPDITTAGVVTGKVSEFDSLTAETGGTVEVTLPDGSTEVVNVGSDGTFSLDVPELGRNDEIVFTPTDAAGNVGAPHVERFDPVPMLSDVRLASRSGQLSDTLNAGNVIDVREIDATGQGEITGMTLPYSEVTLSYRDGSNTPQTLTTTADEFGSYRFDLLTGGLVEVDATIDLLPTAVGTDFVFALTPDNKTADIAYVDDQGVEQTISLVRSASGSLTATGSEGAVFDLDGNTVVIPMSAVENGALGSITDATEVVPSQEPERIVPEDTVTVTETYTSQTTAPDAAYREVDDGTRAAEDADFVLIEADFNRDIVLDTTNGTPRLRVLVGDEEVFADFSKVTDANTLEFKLVIEPGWNDADGISIPTSDTQLTSGGTDTDHNLASSNPAIRLNGATITDALRTGQNAWLDYTGAEGDGTPDNPAYKVDTEAPQPTLTILGVSTNLNANPEGVDGDSDDALAAEDFSNEITGTQFASNQDVWIGGKVEGEFRAGDTVTLTIRYLDLPDGTNIQTGVPTGSSDPATPSVSPELVEKTVVKTATVGANGGWKATMKAQDLVADADLSIEARLDTHDAAGNRAVVYDTLSYKPGFFNIMSAQGLNDIADVDTDRDPTTSAIVGFSDLYGSMNTTTVLPFLQNAGNFSGGETVGIYDKTVNILTDYNWGLSYSDMRLSTVMFEGETWADPSNTVASNTFDYQDSARWADKYYTANYFVNVGNSLIIANDNWHYGGWRFNTETVVNPYRWENGGSLAAAFDFVGIYDDDLINGSVPYARGDIAGLTETGADPTSGTYDITFISETDLNALPAAADAINAAKSILDGVFSQNAGKALYGESITVPFETDTYTIHERALTERDVVLARDGNGNAVMVLRQQGAGYVLLSADQDLFDSDSLSDQPSTGSLNEILVGNAFTWADQYGARVLNGEAGFASRPDYQPYHEGGEGWYYYRVGDTVSVQLKLDGNVTVESGAPTMDLDIAGDIWKAEFSETVFDPLRNETRLVFDFTISDEVQSDYWREVASYSEGIHLPGNGFDANGATVKVDGIETDIEYGDYRRSYEPYPDGYIYNPFQMVLTTPARAKSKVADQGLGWDMDAAGDVNGDGFEDFLITAPARVDFRTGVEPATYVVYGGAEGMPPSINLDAMRVDQGFRIDNGFLIAEGVGDFNGDGYDDIMLSNHYNDQTVVIFGAETGREAVSAVGIANSVFGTKDGFAVFTDGGWDGTSSSAADLNNDGYVDIIVGNPEYLWGYATVVYGGPYKANTTGAASSDPTVIENLWVHSNGVFSGALELSGWQVVKSTDIIANNPGTNASVDWFATVLEGYGDFNNDGIEDLILTSPYSDVLRSDGGRVTDGGSVWVIFGQQGAFGTPVASHPNDKARLGSAEDPLNFDVFMSDIERMVADGEAIRIDGTQLRENLGSSVDTYANSQLVTGNTISSLGDVNGDGYTDLAIGAPAYGNTASGNVGPGRVYILYGGANGLKITEDDPYAIDNAHKLDTLTADEGLILEQADASSRDAAANFGFSVRGVGDVNGDGVDDFIVGAPGANGVAAQGGAAYLVFGGSEGFAGTGTGASGIVSAEQLVADGAALMWEGMAEKDFLGTSSALGDWNGDGLADIAIPTYAQDAFVPNPVDPAYGQPTILLNSGGYNVYSGRTYANLTAGFDEAADKADVIDASLAENRDADGVARVTGGVGDDVIIGIGGNAGDVGYGGHGSDVIETGSLNFTRIDGGLGVDTMKLADTADGVTINLSVLGGRVKGFEVFDITGGGDNGLVLRLSDVLNQPETSGLEFDNLRVKGDAGDTVELVGDQWEATGSQTVGGVVYDVWSNTQLTTSNVFDDVYIQQGITVS